MNKLASTLFESAVKALDSGNPAVAMDCVVHSLQVQPDNPLALLLKAHIELAQARKADQEGRSTEAQKAAQAAAKSFEQLLESNPPLVRQYLDAQLGMAEALLLLGKRRDALFWLDAAERKLSQAVADKRLLGNDQASLAERINSLRGKAR
jgi:tetratricopeptide (TPR) repeat protein